MTTRNIDNFWWVRLKARKTRVLEALASEDFTYLNLPDALCGHTTDAKRICGLAGLSETIIDQLKDACISTCEANKEIVSSVKRNMEKVKGETDRDAIAKKLEGQHGRAKQKAARQIHQLYELAERTINRFPGPDIVPLHDLPEQATDLFLNAAYWIEYSVRALLSGLKYMSKKVDSLMEGDSKPLDAATDITYHEVEAAKSETVTLFLATPEDFVMV
ncbi:hypothetical protein Hte_007917 [Hypoxylon texense]